MTTSFQVRTISHEASLRIAGATMRHATGLGVPVVVAVLDQAGHPKLLCRMDGAPVASVSAAQDKAYTALLGLPSGALHEAIRSDPPTLASLPATQRMTLIPGGFPLVDGGALIGAIGVGGGTTAQDVACAEAGVRALEHS